MRKLILPLVSLLLSSFPDQTYSQRIFQPGYIIQINNDSLHGFISVKTGDNNPSEIYFRTNDATEPVTYNSSTLKGFSINDESYQSAVVNIHKGSNMMDHLSSTPAFTFEKNSVFLRVLVAGIKPLCFYRDNFYENFYISREDSYDLLLYKKYLKSNADNSSSVVTVNRYMDQLKVYLTDCSSIEKKIVKTNYEMNSLLALFNNYLTCKNLSSVYRKEIEKTKTEFGVLGGASFTTVKFTGSDNISKNDFSTSTNGTGGVFLEIILPRNLKRFSINNELVYSSFQVAGDATYADPDYAQYFYKNHSKIGGSYIKLNNMLRFSIPFNRASVFLNAGMSNGFAVKETNYSRTETIRFNTVSDTTEDSALRDFKAYEQGFIAGIGARYKKYSLEFRYERGNGMAAFLNLKSHVSRFSALFAYRFSF